MIWEKISYDSRNDIVFFKHRQTTLQYSLLLKSFPLPFARQA